MFCTEEVRHQQLKKFELDLAALVDQIWTLLITTDVEGRKQQQSNALWDLPSTEQRICVWFKTGGKGKKRPAA